MDKEIRDKHYRVVGMLQMLENAAKAAYCMPCDHATQALIDAVRSLTNRAATSAWEYAERQTAEGKSGE